VILESWPGKNTKGFTHWSEFSGIIGRRLQNFA
jgi:hypothetical protein